MAKVIIVFSTKGGVGKTLVAANLAVAFGNELNKRVCLIDMDTQVVGDMARMLDLSPEKAMVDLIDGLKRHPKELKKEAYLSHNQLNFDFLPAVLKPQQSPHLDASMIPEVFNFLSKDYDYIIVDAGKSFNDIFVNTLNQANLILLIVTPDILSVYQSKWALDTLQSLNFPFSMIKVILNRTDSLASISWQEVRVTLPVDIIAKIPSEGRVVGQAINRGIPVILNSPKARSSMAIRKLAFDMNQDEKMFVEHLSIDEISLKSATFEKPGEFWQKRGLVKPLLETNVLDEGDELFQLKKRIHNRLIGELNLKRLDLKVFSDIDKTNELKDKAALLVINLITEESGGFITSEGIRKQLVKEILDEALGLGPLEDLLADPAITDIMVNNKDEIYVERYGKIELTGKKFASNTQVKTVIERIIAPLGRRIDESVPMVDARLSDGSRVNAIIPPLALTGPSLTIRKFRKERFKIEELIELKTINSSIAEFLKACVVSRKNIIVSGGTGSGKTTILNVISGFVPNNERIVTIEDAAELRLHQDHWIRLESRSSNIEGKGAITIRDIFRNTLRMRPDRIIIGECRGIESLDMLQAMNTGHDGSMTTIHANSTQDALSRIDSMILMSGIELPVRSIREMIASAVDVIVHVARLSDGSRKIIQVTELAGMKDETHIDLRDIFIFKQTGIDSQGKVLGSFQATGHIPSFYTDMGVKGILLSDGIFKVTQ